MASSADKSLAGLSLFQGLSGAFATFEQAKAKKTLSEVNQRLAEAKARDALRRGNELVGINNDKVKKTIGSQRASFAAQGVRVDAGSARNVQSDTAITGALDALAIKNSALREAFGFKIQAINAQAQGDLALLAGVTKSFDTLLTGGIQAAAFTGGLKTSQTVTLK